MKWLGVSVSLIALLRTEGSIPAATIVLPVAPALLLMKLVPCPLFKEEPVGHWGGNEVYDRAFLMIWIGRSGEMNARSLVCSFCAFISLDRAIDTIRNARPQDGQDQVSGPQVPLLGRGTEIDIPNLVCKP